MLKRLLRDVLTKTNGYATVHKTFFTERGQVPAESGFPIKPRISSVQGLLNPSMQSRITKYYSLGCYNVLALNLLESRCSQCNPNFVTKKRFHSVS